ncbi:uncharacterized protein NFIA_004510 [Aspergillus fischeri NRRL 181]|uniref:Uncharacterized protein n=1 Tax=Neosartorya fischeri (strain ATCC 1020 / DSM 3700 / CBS 544.65 / FGSC A1164 / JCM 1740 / NRRL 181 / WB 181) TaxID=331117 RepID=A1DK54_NEOFI|nr:uncharacterized protein NFIA_004510 [Aspergillus fischeri NRRL 181]EAW17093.1 hypothetical protein NFIA_004510 [Aspergillus fischeri NRRL 181]
MVSSAPEFHVREVAAAAPDLISLAENRESSWINKHILSSPFRLIRKSRRTSPRRSF